MDQNRLKKQMDFIREIDREKQIDRQNYITGGVRKENDAEHAWHMAVMAFLLSEYAAEKTDLLRVLKMILLHDVVEIDAGDTYAYDEEAKKTQRVREEAAADRIYGLLPADQRKELKGLWEEFEAGETPEARFARTLDNLQPMMLNSLTDGKAWEEHGVCLDQILHRNRNTAAGSAILWDYARENWLRPHVKKGKIKTGK